jgi:hypothetical protein
MSRQMIALAWVCPAQFCERSEFEGPSDRLGFWLKLLSRIF